MFLGYLLEFLQRRQQTTTSTRRKRQTDDIDQKAILNNDVYKPSDMLVIDKCLPEEETLAPTKTLWLVDMLV